MAHMYVYFDDNESALRWLQSQPKADLGKGERNTKLLGLLGFRHRMNLHSVESYLVHLWS